MEFLNIHAELCAIVQEPVTRLWFCISKEKPFCATRAYPSISAAWDDGLSGIWQRRKQEVPNDTA